MRLVWKNVVYYLIRILYKNKTCVVKSSDMLRLVSKYTMNFLGNKLASIANQSEFEQKYT